eukprot:2317429-Amphidinium_carterae.1
MAFVKIIVGSHCGVLEVFLVMSLRSHAMNNSGFEDLSAMAAGFKWLLKPQKHLALDGEEALCSDEVKPGVKQRQGETD